MCACLLVNFVFFILCCCFLFSWVKCKFKKPKILFFGKLITKYSAAASDVAATTIAPSSFPILLLYNNLFSIVCLSLCHFFIFDLLSLPCITQMEKTLSGSPIESFFSFSLLSVSLSLTRALTRSLVCLSSHNSLLEYLTIYKFKILLYLNNKCFISHKIV